MNTLREAAQQALKALELVVVDVKTTPTAYEAHRQAIAALRAALAEQPAEQCNHCNGSGRMVRDPDIGTDQECFVCNGDGFVKPEQPAEQEPVAWMSPGKERLEFSRKDTVYGSHTIPLYTAPQPRRRLTDEELRRVIQVAPEPSNQENVGRWVVNVCRAVEAAIWSKT